MTPNRVYRVAITRQAITTAITLIQIAAGASVPLQIIRARLAQASSTTSTQLPIQINRKTAAATVTPFTPVKCGPATDPAASAVAGAALTGVNATVEGTDGDMLEEDDWNYLTGWTWIPTFDDRRFVDAGGIVVMKLPLPPVASVTLTGQLVFKEVG